MALAGGNGAPVLLPIRVQAVDEGGLLEIHPLATDLDGDALVYGADHLPAGAVFDSSDNTLRWRPGYSAAGRYTNVELFVSDGRSVTRQLIEIDVANINQAPVLIPLAERSVREGDLLALFVKATDADGDALEFSSPNLPAGATLAPETGRFLWIPRFDQHGDYRMTVVASDGKSDTAVEIILHVINVNAPVRFQDFGGFDIFEGQPLQVRLTATDADHPALTGGGSGDGADAAIDSGNATGNITYKVQGVPAGATFDLVTQVLKWTPGNRQSGTYTVSITATDDGDGTGQPSTAAATLTIHVLDANSPPVLPTIANQQLASGSTLDIPILATDPDGGAVHVAVAGLPSWAVLEIRTDGSAVIHARPGVHERGAFDVTVFATDDGNGDSRAILTTTTRFILAATTDNVSPHFAPVGDVVAVVGQELRVTLHVTDLDEDSLTFTADQLPAGAKQVDSGIYGEIRYVWTPAAGDVGNRNVTYRVHDSGNGKPAATGSDAVTVRWLVRASNQGPVLGLIPAQSAVEGVQWVLTPNASDADGDTLFWRVENLPAGATVSSKTGEIRWTPSNSQAGDYTLRIIATDGNQSAAQVIQLAIANSNRNPQVAAVGPYRVDEASLLNFRVFASDPDGDNIIYRAVSPLPAGATLDPATGELNWTPRFDQAGDYLIELAASDTGGASGSSVVLVHVLNVDRAPVLPDLGGRVLRSGVEFRLALPGSDPDSGTRLKYSVTGLPSGAVLNPDTGELRWVPSAAELGDYTGLVTVDDGELQVRQALRLVVSPTPVPPVVRIEFTPEFAVSLGQSVVLQASATGIANLQSISLSINGVSQSLDKFGRVTFTPSNSGHYLIRATALDVDGQVSATVRDLKVRDPNDSTAPEIAFMAGSGTPITQSVPVIGSVYDTNLDSYQLEIAQNGSDRFVTLASGDRSVTGTLTAIDPSKLLNGFYRLRLTAMDISGHSSSIERLIEIRSAAKTGAFTTESTDLATILGGVPVQLTRGYNSLRFDIDGTFGGGWNLLGADVQASTRTSALGGGLDDRSRVYLNLPDGRRVGFAFSPERVAGVALNLFRPTWTADAGSGYRLDSGPVLLTQINGQFYEAETGRLYNPFADVPDSGDSIGWSLTGSDGTRWSYEGERLRTVANTTGASLLWSDSGIISSSGKRIAFEHDTLGHLNRVVDSSGAVTTYTYKGGLLTGVQPPLSSDAVHMAYAGGHLVLLTATSTQPGRAVQYDDNGIYTAILPVVGRLILSGAASSGAATGTLTPGGTAVVALDVRGRETSASGRLLIGIEIRGELGLLPAVPKIAGLAPVLTSSFGSRTFALYLVDAGASLGVSVTGVDATTAGRYTVESFLAGDADLNGLVDGADLAKVRTALGTRSGQAGYSLAADVNRDGVVDPDDVSLLNFNLGSVLTPASSLHDLATGTHRDFGVRIDLQSLVNGSGTGLKFSLSNVVGGTVILSNDGQFAFFQPAAGAQPVGSFKVTANDAGVASNLATVTVQISDAALVSIRVGDLTTRVPIGTAWLLPVFGDFADAKDVPLTPGGLTYTSTNPAVVAVGANGGAVAIQDGEAVVIVSRGNLHAAVAVAVGSLAPSDRDLANGGLRVAPGALVVEPGVGTQALRVLGTNGVDLTSAASGTRYVSGDESIAHVTAEGLVTGVKTGETTITVLYRFLALKIRVRVEAARPAPIAVGSNGGVVSAADGTRLTIPPGALPGNATVLYNTLREDQLPYALIPGQIFGTGFRLDIGPTPAVRPIQVAVRMLGTLAGTQVVFYRAGEVPGLDGAPEKAWIQVAFGVVGQDSMVQTDTSVPTPGVTESGDYLVSLVDTSSTGLVRGHLDLQNPIAISSLGFYILARPESAPSGGNSATPRPLGPPFPGVSLAVPIVVVVDSPVKGNSSVSGILLADSILNLLLRAQLDYVARFDTRRYKLYVCEKTIDSPVPVFTSTVVSVIANQTLAVSGQFKNTVLPSDHPSQPPVILSATSRLGGSGDTVQVFLDLKVDRLLWALAPQGLGSLLKDISVVFEAIPDGTNNSKKSTPVVVDSNALTYNSATKILSVQVPKNIAIGAVQIRVHRTQNIPAPADDGQGLKYEPVTVISAPVRLPIENNYVFAVLSSTNEILVLDARTALPVALARIPVTTGSARALTLTADLTRLYASLFGSNGVAVFDAVTLQPIDADPSTPDIDAILLPAGARAFWVASSPGNDFVVVTDEKSPNLYVIDIRVGSPTYHQVIQTVLASPAPSGLRGVAIDADGSKVYAAAPDAVMFGSGGRSRAGKILVYDVSSSDGGVRLKASAVIVASNEPYGVTASNQSGRVVYANRLTDGNGFGSINNLKSLFAELNLGSHTDAFDFNNAIGAAVLPNGDYAFVSGFNQFIEGLPSHDPNIPPFTAGGNIGIIKDPFGVHGAPQLVAATVMVPNSFPDNLVISPDRTKILAAYRTGLDRGIYVYDIAEIIKTVNLTSTDTLTMTPLDTINPKVFVGRINTGGGRPQGLTSRITLGGDLHVSDFPDSEAESGGDTKVSYTVSFGAGTPVPGTSWTEKLYLVNSNGLKRLVTEGAYTSAGKRELSFKFPIITGNSGTGTLSSEDLVGLKWQVELDTANTVTENSEANNMATGNLKLRLPNLVVGEIVRPWVAFNSNTRKFVVLSDKSQLQYTMKNSGDAVVREGEKWSEELWIGTDEDVTQADNISAGIWHLRIRRLGGTEDFAGEFAVGGARTRVVAVDLSKIVIPAGIDANQLEWVVVLDAPSRPGLDAESVRGPPRGAAQLESKSPSQTGTVVESKKDDNVGYKKAPGGETLPLRFSPDNPWEYDDKTLRATVNGLINIGFEPLPSVAFVGILQADGGTTTIDFKNGFIEVSGKFKALIGGVNDVLLDGTIRFGFFRNPDGTLGQLATVAKVVSYKDPVFNALFRLGGVPMTIRYIGIANSHPFVPGGVVPYPGEIQLYTALQLPDNFKPAPATVFDVVPKDVFNGLNTVEIGIKGISFAAARVNPTGPAGPQLYNLDGFKLKTETLDFLNSYDSTEPTRLRLAGSFLVSQLGDARLKLDFSVASSGPGHFSFGDDGKGGVDTRFFGDYALVDPIKFDGGWMIKDLKVKLIPKADGPWDVSGEGKVVDPKGKDVLKVSFIKVRDDKGIRLEWTSELIGDEFWVSGIKYSKADGGKVSFVSDRNLTDTKEWDPLIQVSGLGRPDENLVGAMKDQDAKKAPTVTTPDKDDERIQITQDETRNGKDNKAMPLEDKSGGKVFRSFKAVFENMSFQFEKRTNKDGSKESVLILHGKITLTEMIETPDSKTERAAIIDFTGKDASGADRYVELSSKGIRVNGEIQLKGPFNITKDGTWQLKELKMSVKTTDTGLEIHGTALLKTPGAKTDSELQLDITPAKDNEPEQIHLKLKNDKGIAFSLLGFDFLLKDFDFVSHRKLDANDPPLKPGEKQPAWDPQLLIRGEVSLPKKITGGKEIKTSIGTDKDGKETKDRLIVDARGVQVTEGLITLEDPAATDPKKRDTVKFNLFNSLEVIAIKIEVRFKYTFELKQAILTGKFQIPSLGNLEVNLSGKDDAGNDRRILVKEEADGKIQFEANARLTAERIDLTKPVPGVPDNQPAKLGNWRITDVQIDVLKKLTVDTVDVTGKAKIVSPDYEKADVDFSFKKSKFFDLTIQTGVTKTVKVFGAELNINYIHLLADHNTANLVDWEPQVELRGFLILPEKFGKPIGATQIKAELKKGQELVINADAVYFRGGEITIDNVDFTLFNQIEVHGENLKLVYKMGLSAEAAAALPAPADPTAINFDLYDQFTITGKMTAKIRGAVVTFDFSEKDKNSIRILRKDGENFVALVGTVKVENIIIVKGVWEINEVVFKFDTIKDFYEGSAKLTFPGGVGVDVTLGFLKGKLNKVYADAIPFPKGLKIPLGTTGAFLIGAGAGVENLADPSKDILFKGTLVISAGPNVAVPLPEWAGGPVNGVAFAVRLDAEVDKTHLKATATAIAIGDVLTFTGLAKGSLTVDINWSTSTFTMHGDLAILGGLISQTGDLNLDAKDRVRLDISGSASVRLPSVSPIPKSLWGVALLSTSAKLHYKEGDPFASFVAGWGSFDFPSFTIAGHTIGGKQTLGVIVHFDGSPDWIFNPVSKRGVLLGAAVIDGLSVTSSSPADAEGVFRVTGDTEWIMLNANWTNPANGGVPLTVQLPDGTRISEADFAKNNMAVVDSLTSPTGKSVFVAAPKTGQYRLIVPRAGLGDVTFDAIRDSGPAPDLHVVSPVTDQAGNSVNIEATSTSTDPNARVYFYYDQTGQGTNGSFIDDVPLIGGKATISWDVSTMPRGDYHVYAVLLDSKHPPITSEYAAGKIHRGSGPVVPVQGRVFHDTNQNGVIDTGESGLAGWTIYVDRNENSALDSGELQVKTDVDGNYKLELEAPASYLINVVVPAGFSLSSPSTDLGSAVPITVPTTVSVAAGPDFGAMTLGAIAGTVYNDQNVNNQRDGTEAGVSNVTVFIDRNGNRSLDLDETAVTTNGTGAFTFSGLRPGTYTVMAVEALDTVTSVGQAIVPNTGAGVSVLLGRQSTGSIRGGVFVDANGNGIRDNGETGLTDSDVFLDSNGNGVLDLDEATVVTGADGSYQFSGLSRGTYSVRVSLPTGFGQTAPAGAYSVDLTTVASVSSVNFAAFPPGFTNGTFTISSSSDPRFGWTSIGNAVVRDGVGELRGGAAEISRFEQTFALPASVRALRFTLRLVDLKLVGELPPTFEISFLEGSTGSLFGSPQNLTLSDAGFNLQGSRVVYFAESTRVPGAGASGSTADIAVPVTIEIPISDGGDEGTVVRLVLSLTGGDSTSGVVVDDVELLVGTPLSLQLAPESDSGLAGDRLTNKPVVTLAGDTLPNTTVDLDLNGDGFNDGTVTSDGSGQYLFQNVSMKDGPNAVRVRIQNSEGPIIAEEQFTLDRVGPQVVKWIIGGGGAQRSMVTSLEVQFSEAVYANNGGPALKLTNLTASLDASGAALQGTGVGGATIRWTFPALTGGSVPDGNYVATVIASAVTDAAGNALAADNSQSFHRLFGDQDGDRDVDFVDLFAFRETFGRTSAEAGFDVRFDFNGDDVVGLEDKAALQSTYFTVLPPPAAVRPAIHRVVQGTLVDGVLRPKFVTAERHTLSASTLVRAIESRAIERAAEPSRVERVNPSSGIQAWEASLPVSTAAFFRNDFGVASIPIPQELARLRPVLDSWPGKAREAELAVADSVLVIGK